MPLIASGRPGLRLLAALSCAVGARVCGPAFTQALVAAIEQYGKRKVGRRKTTSARVIEVP